MIKSVKFRENSCNIRALPGLRLDRKIFFPKFQSMRPLTFLLFLSVCLCATRHVEAQNFLNGVVKIQTSSPSGAEGETGAGIVAGQIGYKVFILTAWHVVENAEAIIVQFNGVSWKDYPARLHGQVNFDLDIAVLVAEVPWNEGVQFFNYREADYDDLKKGDPVTAVGHPYGAAWSVNKMNSITNERFGTYEVSFTAMGIQPGFSGGPLLDRKKNRLLGMITRVEPNSTAVAVTFNEIKRYLTDWSIPYSFILPYKEPLRTSTYILGGLAIGATAAGVYFNDQGAEEYALYKQYRDPVAFLEKEGRDRDEVYGSAKDFYTYRNISYGVAGGLALAAVLANVIKPKKSKTSSRPSGPSNFYGSIDLSPAGAQYGIKVKF